MSDTRKCPACGQTIVSLNDAIFCTRRDPCLVASHYASMGSHPDFFANEEDKIVALMNKVHGVVADFIHKAETALGIDPPPPAVDSAPEVPPVVANDGGGFSSETPVPATGELVATPEGDKGPATPAPELRSEDSAPVAPESSGASGAAANDHDGGDAK